MPLLVSILLILTLPLLLWAVLGPHDPTRTHSKHIYRRRELMSANEREFLTRLEAALPEFRIFSQVAMSGIIDVALPASHPAYWRARSSFDKKRIDFVVCTRDASRTIAVVELDDRSHDSKREQDAKRDAMLASAGLHTVRFGSYPRPSKKQIRESVLRLTGDLRSVA